MLEVGNLASAKHDRANFGAWIIISAPLYLSFDLSNEEIMHRVWPFISNKEAIEINQQWSGHPGRLVKSWTPIEKIDTLNVRELNNREGRTITDMKRRNFHDGTMQKYYIVTSDVSINCRKGWKYDNVTGLVSIDAPQIYSDGSSHVYPDQLYRRTHTHTETETETQPHKDFSSLCLSVPLHLSLPSWPCPFPWHHGGYNNGSMHYCDDAVIELIPCNASDISQRFNYSGIPGTYNEGITCCQGIWYIYYTRVYIHTSIYMSIHPSFHHICVHIYCNVNTKTHICLFVCIYA